MKLTTLKPLLKEVKKLRKAGKTIALANGCFDLIHVGHIRFLQEAKKKGDVLIVALNADDSVRQIKGALRPIFDQDDRADIISAIEFVDYVIIFNEPTVAKLLHSIKPDIHCKGTDYTYETVPEREVVKEYGGTISIVGDAKDHSSKDIIKQIVEKYSPHGSTI
jgi:rfaE bifunctional protein nucleotidyltransferase chain/domain